MDLEMHSIIAAVATQCFIFLYQKHQQIGNACHSFHKKNKHIKSLRLVLIYFVFNAYDGAELYVISQIFGDYVVSQIYGDHVVSQIYGDHLSQIFGDHGMVRRQKPKTRQVPQKLTLHPPKGGK